MVFSSIKKFFQRNQQPEIVKKALAEGDLYLLTEGDDLETLNRHDIKYPAAIVGYPTVYTGEYLLRRSKHYRSILGSVGMSREEFGEYLMPVFINYARLVHMLPASQNHHHAVPGGLLIHGLEVACFMRNRCKVTAFDTRLIPAERSKRRDPWMAASVISGLLHDAGKALTDMRVTDRSGELTWSHRSGLIEEWAKENQIDNYFLVWNKDRHKHHIKASRELLAQLCPPKTLLWIEEGGKDIYRAMGDAIEGIDSSPLTEMLLWADGKSVNNDISTSQGHNHDTGVPVLKILVDAMRRLIATEVWTHNAPGSRVWVTTQGVFIAWAAAAQEMVSTIISDGVSGVPRSPDSILLTLTDHGIAQKAPDGDSYWYVAPDIIQKGTGTPLALKCMKLAEADTLFPHDPLPAPTSISIRQGKTFESYPAPNESRPAIAPVGSANKHLETPTITQPTETDEGKATSEPSDDAATRQPKKKAARRKAEVISSDTSAAPEASHPEESDHAPFLPAADTEVAQYAPIESDTDTAPIEVDRDEFLHAALLSVAENIMPGELIAARKAEQAQAVRSLDSILDAGSDPASPPEAAASSAGAEQSRSLSAILGTDAPNQKKSRKRKKAPDTTDTTVAEVTPQKSPESTDSTSDASPKVNQDALLPADEPESVADKPAATHDLIPSALPATGDVGSDNVAADDWQSRLNILSHKFELSDREHRLLSLQPELAVHVLETIEIASDVDIFDVLLRRVFIRLSKDGEHRVDESLLPRLIEAGWLWDDFTSTTGKTHLFTARRREGVIPVAWLEDVLLRNLTIDLTLTAASSLSQERRDALRPLCEEVINAAKIDTLDCGPVLSITDTQVSRLSTSLDTSIEDIKLALQIHRDAVHLSSKRKTFIRPIEGELNSRGK